MSEDESPFRFEQSEDGPRFSFDVRAVKSDRQLKKASFGAFEIVCDEPALIGGDDAAPPPLAYFAASLAF